MKLIKWAALTVLGLVVLTFGAYGAFWVYASSRPANFEECKLAEMQGQAEAMLPTVQVLCERRFAVEILHTPSATDWTWIREDDGRVSLVTFAHFETDFIPRRASVRLSDKSCDVALAADYEPELALHRNATTGSLTSYTQHPAAQCLRLVNLWVQRR